MSQATTEKPTDALLGLVRAKIDADLVLRDHLGSGRLWAGDRILRPSGLDMVACTLARTTFASETGRVALAIPRGRGPLPVILGFYLVLWRIVLGKSNGEMCGSVAISTNRTELRQLARGLTFDGSALDAAVPVARLVSEPLANKRVRAAAFHLDRSSRHGLTQSDSYLLFQLPNRAPPVTLNVISAMVVDTFGASHDSWVRTYEQNDAARRRQVWIGELGDEGFGEFCKERSMPLVNLSVPPIEAASRAYGVGSSDLASTGCSERSLQWPPVAFRLVDHLAIDEELREFAFRLMEIRRRGRDDGPDAVMYAAWLASLLARLACPLEFYERASTTNLMAKNVEWLLERVLEVGSSAFRNRWKKAFESHWTGVKAAAKGAREIVADADECPKYWALMERLTALEQSERLRVLCQTQTERKAVQEALLAGGLVSQEDFGQTVEVASFSQRIEHGPDDETVTLLLAPPSLRHAALYLGGERGRVEVLCYPFEVPRLRGRLLKVWRGSTDPSATQSALRQLGFDPEANQSDSALPAEESLLVELEGYRETGKEARKRDEPHEFPAPDAEFWKRLPELYGMELAADDGRFEDGGDAEGGGYSGLARLVTFLDGPSMYFRDDADCTVVVQPDDHKGDPDVASLCPEQLQRGMRLAVLPGSERGGLLDELMAAWDEGLVLVRHRYERMYRRALDAAIERHSPEGLATIVGLSEAAVRSWHAGRAWPGSAESLVRLLEASGDEEAIKNQALINSYFNRVRGAHRYIGRVLNEAFGDTVLHHTKGDSVRKLEKLVGMDLTDFFDATSVLTVETVSEPRSIPAQVCGHFLDPSDPYLHAKGAL